LFRDIYNRPLNPGAQGCVTSMQLNH